MNEIELAEISKPYRRVTASTPVSTIQSSAVQTGAEHLRTMQIGVGAGNVENGDLTLLEYMQGFEVLNRTLRQNLRREVGTYSYLIMQPYLVHAWVEHKTFHGNYFIENGHIETMMDLKG